MTSPESYWDALHEMPKGILDGLKNAELTEQEYRRLCPAMDRLWNAFGIRCLGRYYSNKDIQDTLLTNCKAEVFQNAVKYVKPNPGTGATYQLASALFLFFAFGDRIEEEYKKGKMDGLRLQLIVHSYLYDAELFIDNRIFTSRYKISFDEKDDPKSSLAFLKEYIDKREKEKKNDYFILPKQVMNMDLSGGELLVFTVLMYYENRETYSCYPSFRSIGSITHMTRNTVMKHVRGLEQKGLIETEQTQVTLRDGGKHNGTLLYHIKPIADAWEAFEQRQLKALYEESARANAQKNLEEYDKKHPRTKPEKKPEEIKKKPEKPPKTAETEEELPF